MKEIRSSNPPLFTAMCDPNKSWARHYRGLKLGSKLKYLKKKNVIAPLIKNVIAQIKKLKHFQLFKMQPRLTIKLAEALPYGNCLIDQTLLMEKTIPGETTFLAKEGLFYLSCLGVFLLVLDIYCIDGFGALCQKQTCTLSFSRSDCSAGLIQGVF